MLKRQGATGYNPRVSQPRTLAELSARVVAASTGRPGLALSKDVELLDIYCRAHFGASLIGHSGFRMLGKLFDALMLALRKSSAELAELTLDSAVLTLMPAQADGAKPLASLSWLAEGLLLVRDNPHFSDARIARMVKRNPGTLSRNETYRAAASLARGRRQDRPAGRVEMDIDTGRHRIDGDGRDHSSTSRNESSASP